MREQFFTSLWAFTPIVALPDALPALGAIGPALPGSPNYNLTVQPQWYAPHVLAGSGGTFQFSRITSPYPSVVGDLNTAGYNAITTTVTYNTAVNGQGGLTNVPFPQTARGTWSRYYMNADSHTGSAPGYFVLAESPAALRPINPIAPCSSVFTVRVAGTFADFTTMAQLAGGAHSWPISRVRPVGMIGLGDAAQVLAVQQWVRDEAWAQVTVEPDDPVPNGIDCTMFAQGDVSDFVYLRVIDVAFEDDPGNLANVADTFVFSLNAIVQTPRSSAVLTDGVVTIEQHDPNYCVVTTGAFVSVPVGLRRIARNTTTNAIRPSAGADGYVHKSDVLFGDQDWASIGAMLPHGTVALLLQPHHLATTNDTPGIAYVDIEIYASRLVAQTGEPPTF